MNRRGFLKSIGKVVVGCAVVPSVAKAEAAEGISEIEKDKLLRAIIGPPKCDPCYDDCPHYQQCYGSDTDCDGGNARERTIQMLIDTLNIGNFEPSYPRYMWMSKDCLRRFKSAGIIPKHIEFGKEYNGLIIIKEQEYFVDN